MKNALGIDDCVPVADTTNKVAVDFTAAYKAKYNLDPGYAAAEAYDSVYLAAEALKTAGKLDKKAMADALRTITYQGVVRQVQVRCGPGPAPCVVHRVLRRSGQTGDRRRPLPSRRPPAADDSGPFQLELSGAGGVA